MVTIRNDSFAVNRERFAQAIPRPWVGWRYGRPEPGLKPRKFPIDPRTGRTASVTDRRTWADYPAAAEAVERYRLDGVGVVLTPEAGLTGVDLDGCRNPQTGELDGWANEILTRLPDTYAEASPSGRGVRVFVRGVLPPDSRKRVTGLEFYSRDRYLTVTGAVLPGRPLAVTDGGGGLPLLVAEYLTRPAILVPPAPPAELLGDDSDRIARALSDPRTGWRVKALLAGELLGHPSRSEAEYELARLLGFWTGGHAEQVERLMRTFGTRRAKWDRRPDYLRDTIRAALSKLRRVYTPGLLGTPKYRSKECEDKSVSPRSAAPASPEGQRALLWTHIRNLHVRFRRPVALSARDAAVVIGASYVTASRRMNELVRSGRLYLVSRGCWNRAGNAPGPASVFDLPEFASVPPAREQPSESAPDLKAGRSEGGRPNGPPRFTRTPGGLVAVWRWDPRSGRWLHYGDCPDRDTAAAVTARHLARRSGSWSVGDELWEYSRGRGLRVRSHQLGSGRDEELRTG